MALPDLGRVCLPPWNFPSTETPSKHDVLLTSHFQNPSKRWNLKHLKTLSQESDSIRLQLSRRLRNMPVKLPPWIRKAGTSLVGAAHSCTGLHVCIDGKPTAKTAATRRAATKPCQSRHLKSFDSTSRRALFTHEVTQCPVHTVKSFNDSDYIFPNLLVSCLWGKQ